MPSLEQVAIPGENHPVEAAWFHLKTQRSNWHSIMPSSITMFLEQACFSYSLKACIVPSSNIPHPHSLSADDFISYFIEKIEVILEAMLRVFSTRSKIWTIVISIFFCFPLISTEEYHLSPGKNANYYLPPPTHSPFSCRNSCSFRLSPLLPSNRSFPSAYKHSLESPIINKNASLFLTYNLISLCPFKVKLL